ncbi:MAG TPA: PEGA domain-containing protein [Terriglobales bacterium]|nr:PEGA domain-containing protein [Terriglobales bacterium]
MNRIAAACILSLFLLAVPYNAIGQAYPTSADVASLPILADGTPVKLKVNRNLSSSDAKSGESVELEVIDEVHVGNIIVVQKGGAAFGTISAAQSKHSADHTAKLEVAADYLRLADGDKAPLRGSPTSGNTALAIGPSSVAGKDIKIPSGAEVTAYVNGNIVIDPRKFPQLGGSLTPIPATVLESEVTEITITSSPTSAEVYVDERLVGVAPVKVIVKNGDHTMAIRLAGYSGWGRTFHAAGGAMRFDIDMDKGANRELQYKDELLSTPASLCGVHECPAAPGDVARAARAKKAQQAKQPNSGSNQ